MGVWRYGCMRCGYVMMYDGIIQCLPLQDSGA